MHLIKFHSSLSLLCLLFLFACAQRQSARIQVVEWGLYHSWDLGFAFNVPHPFTVDQYASNSGNMLFSRSEVVSYASNDQELVIQVTRLQSEENTAEFFREQTGHDQLIGGRTWKVRADNQAVTYATPVDEGWAVIAFNMNISPAFAQEVLEDFYAAPASGSWSITQSDSLGITVSHPAWFEKKEEGIVEQVLMTGSITGIRSLALRYPVFGAPVIRFDRSSDARILEVLSSDHPLESRTIGDTVVLSFRREGLGDSIGYIFESNGDWIILTFEFPPEPEVIERILRSLSIDGKFVVR